MDRFFLGLGPGPDPGSDALRALSPSEPQGSVCGGGCGPSPSPAALQMIALNPSTGCSPNPVGPAVLGK